MARIAAVCTCLLILCAAAAPVPTPADAARKTLTLKQKQRRCLKNAAKRRTKRARRRAAKRCRERYAHHRRAAGPPAGLPAPPAPAPGEPAPSPAPLSRYVTVSAREFYLTLSRPLVGAGQVRVELRNQGEDPHDLVVARAGAEVARWGELAPGLVQVKTVTLAAGTYTLLCSLPGHDEIGMKATLRVEG